jgi:hypothetical protein
MISRFVTAVLLAHCLEVISIGQITSQAAPPSVPSALKRVGDLILPNAIDGNFDHLAIDLKRQRLFITPEEAKSVLVLDLTSGKVADRVAVARPHAVLYRADLDRLYVTDGTDGSLRIFEGGSYAPVKRIHLEKDADSIGFDPSRKLLYIANGGGDARNIPC